MISYAGMLKLLVPETILAIAALVILGIDLLVMRGANRNQRSLIACAIAVAACVGGIFWIWNFSETVNVLNGMVTSSPSIQLLKSSILALTIFLACIATDQDFTDHVGEYFGLILLATVGLLFLVGCSEMLVLFVALELASLSFYILVAFSKSNGKSTEAALKYFLFGGVSAAFLLFGLSLVYALTGETNFYQIAERLKGKAINPVMLVAILMIVTGLGFKIAAVPFHFWAPDAYEGAPASSAGLIASTSKIASFFVLAKFMTVAFASVGGSFFRQEFLPGWRPIVGVLALLSMIYGNLAALGQKNVKRLLAYSAISHAGYALLALLVREEQGQNALVFYVITYGLAVLGAFAIVSIVEKNSGDASFENFAGLSERSPFLGLALMIFILSLGGIPPLAGFFGKFYVFASALNSPSRSLGLIWLVVAALGTSTISLYYYLQVLKQAYVRPIKEGSTQALHVSPAVLVAIAVVTFLVVLLGCMPNLLLHRLLP
jgi:NADH-quinone oxidoreductase subunit N